LIRLSVPDAEALAQTAPAVTAPASAGAPATAPSEIDSLRQQAIADAERHVLRRPLLGTYSMNQIVRLALENDRIMIYSDLRATRGQNRIEVSDMPGLCVVRVRREGPNDPSSPLRMLTFQRYNFSDPRVIQSLAEVSAQPGMLTINCAWEGVEGSRSVQFIQHVPQFQDLDNPTAPQVTLYVQGFSGARPEQESARLRLMAPDLPSLARLHPREVEAYLLPTLAAVGQQSLLAPDSRVAYQVFADLLPRDADIARQVQQTIPELASSDFARREHASAELRKLGPAGALALMRVDRSGLNLEQRSRIEALLAGYQTLTPEQVQAKRDDLSFLLTCLTLDDMALRRIANDRLAGRIGKAAPVDLDAPQATREKQVEMLREQLLPPPATRTESSP
jgi:hypothetical protein